MDAATSNPSYVDTEQVHVTMRMKSGVEVVGFVHIRPDGYQSRVSDLLNRANFSFMPVTSATLHRADGSRQTAGCIIVGTDDIELVVCHDDDLDGTAAVAAIEAGAGELLLDEPADDERHADW